LPPPPGRLRRLCLVAYGRQLDLAPSAFGALSSTPSSLNPPNARGLDKTLAIAISQKYAVD